MRNEVLFKNGELEVLTPITEVMDMVRKDRSRKAIIPKPDYKKGLFKLVSLDCNFHFVKDCVQYARLVECSYFMGSIKAMSSELSKLEDKELEEELTIEQDEKKQELEETIGIFDEIITNCYTSEEKAFSNADKLIKFMSVYFSKDYSAFSNFNGFVSFLNNLEDDKPIQVLKPLLQKVLDNFTVAEDDIYYSYIFRVNTTLVEDCKKVYYKGRKIAKSKVKKMYDTEGKNVRLEIVLAVIEDLQRRSRKAYEAEEARLKEEAEAKAKAEAEKKAQEEAEAKAKEEAKAKAEAEKKKEAKKK